MTKEIPEIITRRIKYHSEKLTLDPINKQEEHLAVLENLIIVAKDFIHEGK